MRVVFDVNVLIRLCFGSPIVARLLRSANQGAFTVLAADVLIEELTRTAAKPRLFDRLDRETLDELLAYLKEDAEFVPLTLPFPSCRDRDDEYLLALARDGRADFLVTNDQDLLSTAPPGQCAVVTPEQFLQRLGHTDAT